MASKRNKVICSGEEYIGNVLTKLADRIGLSTNDILFVKTSQTATSISEYKNAYIRSVCLENAAKADKHNFFIELFARQSNTTNANTVFLSSYLVDSFASFLEGVKPLWDDFTEFQFKTPLGHCLSDEEAADEIYRRAVAVLSMELEKTLCFPLAVLDRLSLSKYEGSGTKGTIAVILSNKDPILKNLVWRLKKPVLVKEESVRHLRKIMEGAGGGALAFVADEGEVECQGVLDKMNVGECLVVFQIDGPMSWSIKYRNEVLLQRVFFGFQIDRSENTLAIKKAVMNEFKSNCNINGILYTVEHIKQQHGAAVIIADLDYGPSLVKKRMSTLEKHNKAMRVQFSKTAYRNAEIGESYFPSVASMDGAVIVDINGKIRYVAAILDGVSCTKGDLARGARYNSIKNFVNSIDKSEKILGIVLSEDGGADVITRKPRRKLRNATPAPCGSNS